MLVGEAIEIMPNNSSLRKPPQKGVKTSGGIVEDYDSVTGFTGGSRVYMIYDSAMRCYPEYLITYKA